MSVDPTPDLRTRAIGPAVVASLLVHGTIVGMLFLLWGSSPAAQSITLGRLAIHLVKSEPNIIAPHSAHTAPEAPAKLAPVAKDSQVQLPLVSPSEAGRQDAVVPRSPTPVPPDTTASEALGGSVRVAPTGTLALIGEDLTGRSHSEFGGEVDEPTQLLDYLVPAYPPAALDGRREGTVVAWVVIDATGDLEEFIITQGDDEFAESVREVLRYAKFAPAVNNGKALRFFNILQFDFKLDIDEAHAVPTTRTPAEITHAVPPYPSTGM